MSAPEPPPWVLDARRTAARRVQGYRTDQSLTQEELAFAAQVDRSTIQRIESGREDYLLGYLVRVAHALNVRIADLLA